MIKFILVILLYAALFTITCFVLFFNKILVRIKISFGYKLYEYTKILSYGMDTKCEWHKSDEKALSRYTHYEFVEIIEPYTKKLRP